jgi:hypothetical protein
MLRLGLFKAIFLLLLISSLGMTSYAETKVSINSGMDIYNRYVWRGLDIASTPSLQPTLSISCGNFEFGTWAAYTLSNQASESDEIDFWLSYAFQFDNGASLTPIVTDYYFPNAGINFFNFNNYDAVTGDSTPDPGAHTIEVGLSFTGAESFPITLAGYVNIHNDAGSNAYFQIDYPFMVGETQLSAFVGAATGSEDNPDYYGTDNLQVINLGLGSTRTIKLSDATSIPLNISFIINPQAEIAYLLAGISL